MKPQPSNPSIRSVPFWVCAVLGCTWLALSAGCSKNGGSDRTPVVDTTRPAPPAPTGMISEFTVKDTLVGYERRSAVRWYVTGTNNYTEVTLNGVKVAFSGAITTELLTANAVFVLAINNGVSETRTIKVADVLTTGLWNDGKRWRTADYLVNKQVLEKGSQGQDTLVYRWVSMYSSDITRLEGWRTSFTLLHESKEEQTAPGYPQPPYSGMFVPDNATPQTYFTWKKRVYTVDTMTANLLVVTFDSLMSPGIIYKNRYRYIPE